MYRKFFLLKKYIHVAYNLDDLDDVVCNSVSEASVHPLKRSVNKGAVVPDI